MLSPCSPILPQGKIPTVTHPLGAHSLRFPAAAALTPPQSVMGEMPPKPPAPVMGGPGPTKKTDPSNVLALKSYAVAGQFEDASEDDGDWKPECGVSLEPLHNRGLIKEEAVCVAGMTTSAGVGWRIRGSGDRQDESTELFDVIGGMMMMKNQS